MNYNRAEIVDRQFLKRVADKMFPKALDWQGRASESLLTSHQWIDLFESQVLSRHLDLVARKLKAQGQSFYTIGSSGHEGNAIFGQVFNLKDMAFLHYRSGAHMIQRYKQNKGSTPIYDLLLSLVASSEDPISGGRHKVFGSRPLLVPPQTSTIASHLPKAVGAALSIERAHDLNIPALMNSDSVVLVSFGDASANHASAQTAFNTASWISKNNINLPIVFICEDNNIGISVVTPEGWIKESFSHRPYIHYLSCNGLDLLDSFNMAKEAEFIARVKRRPVFLHMKTVRLMGHAGSDVEMLYRSMGDIESAESNDPLLHTARDLSERGILSSEEIINLYQLTGARVEAVAAQAIHRPKIHDIACIKKSLVSCSHKKVAPPLLDSAAREKMFGRDFRRMADPTHMAKLLNWGLIDLLARYPSSLLFGEDVAQKGGVYHVTDGLSSKFGSRRVFNSILDETSILGTAIGMAQNGLLPIPEIQFLAYVHNAEDQIRGEAATLPFFSQGQFTNPMVVRVAGLGYQKGFGGHFHNDNSLAIFRDIPGLIIAVPSSGSEAVKMLRTCVREAYENGRICVFVEPIALYMTKDLYVAEDKGWSEVYPAPEEEIPLGEYECGGDPKASIAVVSYGNGNYLSRKAIEKFQKQNKEPLKWINLRWIAPTNWEQLAIDLADCKKVVVVDECRRTGGFGEAIITALVERLRPLPICKLIAGEDCFIPLGVAANCGLPSEAGILEALLKISED